MKSMLIFKSARLRQDEFYGFMNEVRRALGAAYGTIPEVANAFISALCEMESVLKVEPEAVTAKELVALDEAVDDAWYAMNAYLKAMVRYPVEATATAARQCLTVFSTIENPTDLSYATQYGKIERLISLLDAIDPSTRAAARLDPLLEDLRLKTVTFTAMYSERTHIKAQKSFGTQKAARNALDAAYRELIQTLNAHLRIHSTPEMERFADAHEQLVLTHKALLKGRTNKATQDNQTQESV